MLLIANLNENCLKDLFYDKINQEYFPERSVLITEDKFKLYFINKGSVLEVVRLSEKKKISKPLQVNIYLNLKFRIIIT